MDCLCLLQGVEESTEPEQQQWVRVALVSQDDKTTYASATAFVTSTAWEVHNATLSPLETDTNAKLSITFQVCKAHYLHSRHPHQQKDFPAISGCMLLSC